MKNETEKFRSSVNSGFAPDFARNESVREGLVHRVVDQVSFRVRTSLLAVAELESLVEDETWGPWGW